MFIVVLAYQLRYEPEIAWHDLDITIVKEIKQLSTLCANQIMIGERNMKGGVCYIMLILHAGA